MFVTRFKKEVRASRAAQCWSNCCPREAHRATVCACVCVLAMQGLLNPATGMSYRKCILEPGGARDAMDSLIEFLGREPTMDAFLETKGLTNDK